ncbi:MAG: Rrf2 family transcriptional regulator [Patescibacteria group bacterium]
MKVSTNSRYGLRAMAYLAKQPAYCSLTQIAKDENISRAYLEKIFIKLKQAGLVDVKQGSTGGYKLAKPANKITVFDIFTVLEKQVLGIKCLTTHNCPMKNNCLTYNVWGKVENSIYQTLKSISLKSLLKK